MTGPIGFDQLTLDRARQRRGTKWSRYDREVLPLWVADMDFDPPEPVVRAIAGHLERGDLGYDVALGEATIAEFVEWMKRRHGWTPQGGEVRTFTSVLHALETALWNRTQPGDGIVCFTPVYHPFLTAIASSSRRLVDVPLERETWRLDPDRLAAAIDPSTRMILLCQPHNPTGRMFDRDEIEAIAAVAERHDLLVISDEVWGDLTHGGPHEPVATVDQRFAGRLVTLGSASKAFNLAGLRTAVAHIDDPILSDVIASMPTHAIGTPSTLGLAATVTAWTECDEWLGEVGCHLTAMRDHAVRRLTTALPELTVSVPEATYLLWLGFERTALADDPARSLLKHGLVALEQGSRFGSDSTGFARLNFATSREILDLAIDRIVDCVERAEANHGRMDS